VRVAILGAGFGLYGYLPALHAISCRIILPERYRATIQNRIELAYLVSSITFVQTENEAIDLADVLIVARRPIDQLGLVRGLLHRKNPHRLLLEKPLAPNPVAASALLGQLEASGKIVRVGYLFGYTDWGQQLVSRAEELRGDLQIKWLFRAHHYAVDQYNWKRAEIDGGGALRFYGIQLISLLAALGFDQVRASSVSAKQHGEAVTWRATLANPCGARCQLEVETDAPQTTFAVTAPALGMMISRQDPFSAAPDDQDRRVPLLVQLCRAFLFTERATDPSDRAAIDLWRAIENVTVREGNAPAIH
jgi:predicted dehydrogenase